MKNKWTLALTFLLGANLFAATMAKEAFKIIPAQTLSDWMTKKTTDLYIYDANNEKTRSEYGAIPGAKLLVSYDKFDAKSELPANKAAKLVFYCANTQCSASHKAAEKAVSAGYKDVYVMSDGIIGWKESGHTTTAAMK